MARALILVAGVLLLREFLPRRRRGSPTAISPYMNSLDGMVSAEQVSLVMDELRARELLLKNDSRGRGSSTSASQNDAMPSLRMTTQR